MSEFRNEAFVPTWLFVLAYIFVWILFGAAAYGLASVVRTIADQMP